jgi:hypothetical protein
VLEHAEAQVAAARGEVVQARAREQVVDRHKGRWTEEEQRRRERKEEDGATG